MAVVIRRRKLVAGVVIIVGGILGAEHQAFPDVHIGKEVHIHLRVAVVILAHQSLGHRVREVRAVHVLLLGAPTAVRVAGGRVGQLLDGRLDDVTVINGVVLRAARHRSAKPRREPLRNLIVHIDTHGEAVEVRTDGDTFLREVTARERILHVVIAAGDVQLVIMHHGILEDFTLPVRTLTQQADIGKLFTRAESDDLGTQVLILGILTQVQHVQLLGQLLDAEIALVRDAGLSGFALACGNHHHAVRRTRTVNGRGRSILQDFHRHDVRRVDGRQDAGVTIRIARNGHTVDDVQRLVAIQRVDTTDAHRNTTARGTRVLRHLHAGRTTLQSLVERRDDGLLDFVLAHRHDRTGQVAALHRTVTHYDHLVQQFGVFFQLHIDHRTLHLNFLADVAYIRKYQRGARGNRQRIPAIQVGNDAPALIAFQVNTHANQRLSIRLGNYGSRHFPVLERIGHREVDCRRPQQQEHQCDTAQTNVHALFKRHIPHDTIIF